ncbi:MAG TPA: 3-isopropylmalate dehydratase large subunit [Candidatus Gallacutalibacter pullistercoris]|nr:3-isopropylmalate dehydratase large subunit [Candidatus Gallacutalibacter pullistercoris]
MGMTIAEKIMAAHCEEKEVRPGQLVFVSVDRLISNEVNSAIAFSDFERLKNGRMAAPERLIIVPDHYAPNKDIKAAEQCKYVREFCHKHGLQHYYEVGRMGIEHVFFHEKGFAAPGELLVGIDSHSCTHGAMGAFAVGGASTDQLSVMTLGKLWMRVPETIRIRFSGRLPEGIVGKDLILLTIRKLGLEGARYKAIEFYGEAIHELSMDSRFTLCNMAVECGAKAAIIPPDETTLAYATERCARPFTPIYADPDAHYEQEYDFDISNLSPLTAVPHSPDNVHAVRDVIVRQGEVPVDQVFLGSCTNGRMEDMRIAASILRGHKIHPKVRMIIIPGSQEVWLTALREGLFDIFIQAGAAVSTPTCGPCLGGHMGVLAQGERCISTTNRNFPGRMGHPDSEIYLTGPAVAAASAVMGRLALPEEV